MLELYSQNKKIARKFINNSLFSTYMYSQVFFITFIFDDK